MGMGTLFVSVVLGGLTLSAGAAETGGAPLRMSMGDGAVSFVREGQTVLRYRYEDVPAKPYVKTLYTPQGVNVLRDSPHDHKHHHGLMFAIKVDGVDFWGEHEAPGIQAHRSFEDDGSEAGFVERLDWLAPERTQVVLKERRRISVVQDESAGATVVVWESLFELPPGKAKATLTGAHYHGLGARFVESIDRSSRFFTPDGEPDGDIVRGDERLTPAPWCALHGEIGGKPVTIAMFGHPDNPRDPTLWFTMQTPFAYLSATMNLWKEPLEVTADAPLRLRYTMAVWDGHTSVAEVAEFWKQRAEK
ncbi:MAG: hypothetical protein GWP08_03645 [Nitrospiraceae bacterium]|nr:hypothetical protein [Nitrospiraceae bacterium]